MKPSRSVLVFSLLTLSLLSAVSAGCKRSTPPSPPAVSQLNQLAPAEVSEIAARKIDAVGIATIERAQLLDKLGALNKDADFRSRADRWGIQGVAAFELGEGGAVVKYSRGTGRAHFSGGNSDAMVGLEAYSFGAVIGGSASQGLIVFVGLENELSANGKYVGKVARAGAATAETKNATLLIHETNGHFAYILAVGQGLTADAGSSNLTLSIE